MNAEARQDLRDLFDAAVAAVDPALLVRRHAGDVEAFLRAMGTPRAVVLAFGKAAVSMTRGACDALGDRLEGGLLVSTEEVIAGAEDLPARIDRAEAEHPVPGRGSVRAGESALRLASSLPTETALLCLVSGGGSSLLCVPAPEILLGEKRITTDLLLRHGADIVEMNTVRKHLSAIKGGQLALAAVPAPVLTLILSDVVGDPIDGIASGPTCGDPTTFADAERALRRYGLLERIPGSVRRRIVRGAVGEIAETPQPGDSRLGRSAHRIIGNNLTALEAARRFAEARGVVTCLRPGPVVGEARDAGRALAAEARSAGAQRARSEPPVLMLSGGETTVTVRGDGRGGRSTELALAFAIEIAGTPGVRLLAAGTDGVDGRSGAAGAYADGETLDRARSIGLDPVEALGRNDSGGFFEALGDLFRTGPTGTNVMDLQLVWIDP